LRFRARVEINGKNTAGWIETIVKGWVASDPAVAKNAIAENDDLY